MKFYAIDNKSRTDVTEAVQIIYDALYHSMDAGSGFLGTDEEDALRDLARIAGFEYPKFESDPCKSCGHERSSHGWGGEHQCNRTEWVTKPTYGREILTRHVASEIPPSAKKVLAKRLEEAKTVDDKRMILAAAATTLHVVEEAYEATVMTDPGVKKKCSCEKFID